MIILEIMLYVDNLEIISYRNELLFCLNIVSNISRSGIDIATREIKFEIWEKFS